MLSKFMKSKLTMKYQSDIQRKQQLEGSELGNLNREELMKLKRDLTHAIDQVNHKLNQC